jgi:hypothetical protein
MTRALASTVLTALLAFAASGSSGCNDPTHDEQVAALGPENPNVPRGPLHRPGQPCLVCHGGIGPASAHFSVGGTVYATRTGTAPAVDATVTVEDINGSVATAQTNQVGNFYIEASQWSPTYPTQPQVALGNTGAVMTTHVGRDGSCATCHSDPIGPTSAGHVYIQP